MNGFRGIERTADDEVFPLIVPDELPGKFLEEPRRKRFPESAQRAANAQSRRQARFEVQIARPFLLCCGDQ
jgi:hypothetical protein